MWYKWFLLHVSDGRKINDGHENKYNARIVTADPKHARKKIHFGDFVYYTFSERPSQIQHSIWTH